MFIVRKPAAPKKWKIWPDLFASNQKTNKLPLKKLAPKTGIEETGVCQIRSVLVMQSKDKDKEAA